MGITYINKNSSVAGLSMPFYNAAGALDAIPLLGGGLFPFFNSSGVADNITMTT
jgi:hypothetical protein